MYTIINFRIKIFFFFNFNAGKNILIKGNEDLARLNQQFYSFNKDHVLGFGSFHEAIITDSQSLIKGNLQSLNKNNYFGVQLEDNLKIYIFTKVAKDQIY